MRPPLSLVPALPAALGISVGIALAAQAPAWAICTMSIICCGISFAFRKHFVAYTSLMATIGSLLWLCSQEEPLPDRYLNRKALIEGKIMSTDIIDAGYTAIISVDRVDGNYVSPTKCYVRISDFLPSPPQQGDRASFTGNITAIPSSPDIPGDAFHPAWLLRNGINYRIFYLPSTWSRVSPPSGLYALANTMRDGMFRAIVNSPVEGTTAAFLIATILGNDYFLSDTITSSYRSAGTAHVLALSGMHVATLAMMVILLFFPLRALRRGFFYGLFLVMLLAWMYALATGLSPSVVRATVMLSVMIIASMMQRESSPFNALCIAAVVILAFSPHSLFSPGFQLSFSAVVTILIFNQVIPAALRRHRIRYYLVSLAFLPVAAMIGTGLVSAYHFHIFPWSFLGGNIIMALVFPLMLSGGFILMLLTVGGVIVRPLGAVLDSTLSVTDCCIDWLATHCTALKVAEFTAWAFVPYAIAVFFLAMALYRRQSEQPYRWSLVVSAYALVMTGVTAGCVRGPQSSRTAYLAGGSRPIMLVCQHQSVSAIALPSQSSDQSLTDLVRTRYEGTARIYGCDSINLLLDGSSAGDCSVTLPYIQIGHKVIRIFDGNVVTRSHTAVNYAVVTQQYRHPLNLVIEACHPDTIVITGDIAPSRRVKLKKECGDTIPCIDLHHRTLKIPF